MKITFLGANHEVTGSCTLIEAAGQRFLIDCGMEQGKDVYENQPIPVAPGEIDWVLATHAHIDHTGMLPLLVRNGFRGKIYATNPTVELCGIMLRDSAHIQEFEAEWKNRKGQRSGAEPVEPMYTVQDAEAAMKLFVGKAYEQRFQLAPGIEARFVDVGHLLGSASIELWITEGETTTKLVFSGDIGNLDQPIIKDPAYIKEADYAFMESTYGDRSHGPKPDYVSELTKISTTSRPKYSADSRRPIPILPERKNSSRHSAVVAASAAVPTWKSSNRFASNSRYSLARGSIRNVMRRFPLSQSAFSSCAGRTARPARRRPKLPPWPRRSCRC